MEKALEILKEILHNLKNAKDLNETNEYLLEQIKIYDEAIAEIKEAIKPKTCDGCKYYLPYHQQECLHEKYCQREFTDYYEIKDNK